MTPTDQQDCPYAIRRNACYYARSVAYLGRHFVTALGKHTQAKNNRVLKADIKKLKAFACCSLKRSDQFN